MDIIVIKADNDILDIAVWYQDYHGHHRHQRHHGQRCLLKTFSKLLGRMWTNCSRSATPDLLIHLWLNWFCQKKKTLELLIKTRKYLQIWF